jgi:NAD(P)-dependent dehydrogenase (short-subunit alcohol dehydrogenase family)
MSWALSAKVVLLTGAASGIGRATMISLLECEATVFAVDLKPNLGYSHPNLYYFNGNLTEEGIIARVVQDCIQKFGKIDALLNVAGIMDTANSVDTLTNLSWEKHLQVNLTVPVYLMREVVPHMLKARGGSIVNVASKAGISGAAAGVAYTASKHGLASVSLHPR